MTDRELVRALAQLQQQPPTIEDWRDLHDTIEAYQQRCLARAIVASPHRAALVAAIKRLAEVD